MFLNIDHCFSRLFGFCCLLHEYTPAFNACSLYICRPIESAAAIVIVVMPDRERVCSTRPIKDDKKLWQLYRMA